MTLKISWLATTTRKQVPLRAFNLPEKRSIVPSVMPAPDAIDGRMTELLWMAPGTFPLPTVHTLGILTAMKSHLVPIGLEVKEEAEEMTPPTMTAVVVLHRVVPLHPVEPVVIAMPTLWRETPQPLLHPDNRPRAKLSPPRPLRSSWSG
jgi:hypothetical protein